MAGVVEDLRLSRVEQVLQLHRRVEAGSEEPLRGGGAKPHGTDATARADAAQEYCVLRRILRNKFFFLTCYLVFIQTFRQQQQQQLRGANLRISIGRTNSTNINPTLAISPDRPYRFRDVEERDFPSFGTDGDFVGEGRMPFDRRHATIEDV